MTTDFRLIYTMEHGARLLIWGEDDRWKIADTDESIEKLVARFERDYHGIEYSDIRRDAGTCEDCGNGTG